MVLKSKPLRKIQETNAIFEVVHRINAEAEADDHSKYNPIERVFGVLEVYWNGDPLQTVAEAMPAPTPSHSPYHSAPPSSRLLWPMIANSCTPAASPVASNSFSMIFSASGTHVAEPASLCSTS